MFAAITLPQKVSDAPTRIGMSLDKQKRIFVLRKKVSVTRSRRFATGLALNVIYYVFTSIIPDDAYDWDSDVIDDADDYVI